MNKTLELKNKMLTTVGGSKGFIVPKAYIDNYDIREDKLYNIIVEESDGKPLIEGISAAKQRIKKEKEVSQ